MKFSTFAALALAALGLLAGCVAPAAPPPMPPPVVETPPKPPVTITPLVLQPGHWDWTGSSYVWQPSQYVPAEGHSNLWVPGYWAMANGGWVWQPGHWQ
jgi:hypothetical protein